MSRRRGASHVFASLKRLALRAILAALATPQTHNLPRPPHAARCRHAQIRRRSPQGDPAAVRSATIGVRVSPTEYATLRAKAAQMHITPAQWLRVAALARRLPSPPVAAINREQYAELARLAADLNQLTRLANEGGRVTVADGLLARMATETKRLRLALRHDRGCSR
jgi:hypothetical protein